MDPKDLPSSRKPHVTAGDLSPSDKPLLPPYEVAGTEAGAPNAQAPAAEPSALPDVSASAVNGGALGVNGHPPALPSNPRKKKLRLAAIITGVVLLLLGGGAAAYWGVVVPNKPENVLKSALVNSFSKEKVQSVGFTGTAAIAGNDGAEFSFDFTGAAAQEGKLQLSASLDALITKVTFDMLSPDGKNFYLKVGGLQGLSDLFAQENPEAAQYISLLNQVNDQWYEISEGLVKQFTQYPLTPSALNEASMQKIAELYGQHQFLVVKETLASEAINGEESHHYKVVVDSVKLKDFAAAIQAANIQGVTITQESLHMFNAGVDDMKFANYPLDIWISKKSKLFTQIAFETDFQGSAVTLRLTVTDYNRPVEVQTPESTKPFLDIFGDFLDADLDAAINNASDMPDNMLREQGSGISL